MPERNVCERQQTVFERPTMRNQTINQINKNTNRMNEGNAWVNEPINGRLIDWLTEGMKQSINISRFSGKPSSRCSLEHIFLTAVSDRGLHLRKNRPSLGNPGATIRVPIKKHTVIRTLRLLHTQIYTLPDYSCAVLVQSFPLAKYCCYLCGWHDDAKDDHGHSSITRKFSD